MISIQNSFEFSNAVYGTILSYSHSLVHFNSVRIEIAVRRKQWFESIASNWYMSFTLDDP